MDNQIIVHATTNYAIFKRLKGNRDITNKRVAIIKSSIESVGYISNPVIVNEKMEIIDGQGRVEALQQLQMPVEYRIIEGIGIDECRAMNLKPTSWSINDFVDSYAEYGNENYVRLKELNKKYGLGYTLLFSISNHKSNSGSKPQNDLRFGTFTMSADLARKVDDVCKYLREFTDIQKKIGGRRDLFYGLVAWCAMQPDVDLERLKVQLHSNHSSFTPFAQSEISLREISKAYNRGYSKSKHRYFDYEWKTKDNLDSEE